MKFKIGYLYEVKHKMQVLDYVLETLSIEEFPLSNKIETIRISGGLKLSGKMIIPDK